MSLLRLILACLALALILGLPLSFLLGLLVGPPIAVAFVASGVAATRVPIWRSDSPLARGRILLRAAAVATVGAAFVWVLVRDRSDNAYLWIAVLGMLLFPVAALFAIAAIWPRVWPRRIALLSLWLVGGPGAVLMLLGVLLSFSTGPRVGPNLLVVGMHGLAFALLVAALWFASRREESSLPATGSA